MKRIIATIVLCIMLIIGCGPALTEKDLPPGFCILKAIDADVYTVEYPMGNISGSVWTDKSKAIEFAIYASEHMNDKPHYDRDDHIWPSCERRKDQ